MEIDKSKMKDEGGKPYTQSLFLEPLYNTEFAIYTMKSEDHIHKGVYYPSIKRLYLEMEDVTEYDFANTYFLDWDHWLRLNENKLIRTYIDKWRTELEMKLRSKAIKGMLKQADTGSYQALKFLADRGWINRAAGRPSKLEQEAEKAKNESIADEFAADFDRIRRIK